MKPSGELKTCTKCGHSKPLSEFYKSPKTHDGYDPRCKMCKKAYDKEYVQREDVKQRRRAYMRTPEMKRWMLAYMREYLKTPKAREYMRNWKKRKYWENKRADMSG